MLLNTILPIGIFFMMYGLGLSLRVSDFVRIVKFPGPFVIGMTSMLLLVPLLAFGLVSTFSLSPALSMGVMLIATAPGGLFSNLMTHVGKGNLALSIALTSTFSLVYIVGIPWLASWFQWYFLGAASELQIPGSKIAGPLILITLLPIVLGMFTFRFLPDFARYVEASIRSIAAVFIFIVYGLIAFDQRDVLLESGLPVLFIVLLLNTGAIAVGFGLARIFELNRKDMIAVTVEHSIRQEGTAIFIAVSLLASPEMAIPLVINGGLGLPLAFLFIKLLKKFSDTSNTNQLS